MAELMLMVGSHGPDPLAQDGDILEAISDRRRRYVHAQHICHHRRAPRNGHGYIDPAHVSRDWFELTSRYRFERISSLEVRRTDLVTLDESIFSRTPDANGESIDVPACVAHWRKSQLNFLFGSPGAEVWYGGKTTDSHAILDLVWSAIATKTGRLESEPEFRRWPASLREKQAYLWITTDDFSEQEAGLMTQPVKSVSGELIRKRERFVDWEGDLGISAAQRALVRNPSIDVDLRDVIHDRASIVRVKQWAR